MAHLSPATTGTLRERFIADMTVRGFTDKTRHDYIRTVAGFAAFLARSPNTATAEDIRRFQIHQSERSHTASAPLTPPTGARDRSPAVDERCPACRPGDSTWYGPARRDRDQAGR